MYLNSYTQHSSFFQYGKMKFTNDLYAKTSLEKLAAYSPFLNRGENIAVFHFLC